MSLGWNAADPARVLVTGCSSGIGEALCVALAERGHRVIATARDSSALADLPVELRLDLDVTDPDSVAAAASAASVNGPVDVLVNNAGLTAWAPVEQLPVDIAQRVFDTNVWGVLRMSQAVLSGMRARGRGRVINVSSASLRGYPLLGLYVASKSALETLSESMRLEVSEAGVDVVLAIPAAVVTSFGKNRIPVDSTDDSYAQFSERAFAFIQGMRGTVLTAVEAAGAIADLVELDDPPLRVAVGADAERLVPQRHTISDADFERTVRTGLG